MKSLLLLLDAVLQDCSTDCAVNTTRDYNYITRRVKDEGLSFLTITLDTFRSDFERSLADGMIASTSFRSFRKNGPIPKLFSGMVMQVFDVEGVLLNEPSISSIRCIRQVCAMWKKIELPCDERRIEAALAEFVEIDSKIDLDADLSEFKSVSNVIWSKVLSGFNPFELTPSHGSGAVADPVTSNKKYSWTEWHQRLEPYFPSDSYCYANSMSFLSECSSLSYVSPELEQPVRVVLVPKTMKSPRTIAIEPVCMQYTQQAILQWLVPRLESSEYTRESIFFTDQRPNAWLAERSSNDGKFSTLDLSSASDRVSYSLVYEMLGSVPDFRDAVFACRSTRAKLPDGLTIHLKKFASMGSALCFPMEAMVFLTIATIGVLRARGLSYSARNIQSCMSLVAVYGDDIIVPTDTAPSVVTALTQYGLKLNAAKSFWTGKFRESCGMDAYDSYDVTPTYVRSLPPSDRGDLRSALATVILSNQLYDKGFNHSAAACEKLVRNIGLRIPYVGKQSAVVGYIRDNLRTVHRFCPDLHVPLVKGYVLAARRIPDRIVNGPALMKSFIKRNKFDKRHLESSIRQRSVTVKTSWSVNQ